MCLSLSIRPSFLQILPSLHLPDLLLASLLLASFLLTSLLLASLLLTSLLLKIPPRPVSANTSNAFRLQGRYKYQKHRAVRQPIPESRLPVAGSIPGKVLATRRMGGNATSRKSNVALVSVGSFHRNDFFYPGREVVYSRVGAPQLTTLRRNCRKHQRNHTRPIPCPECSSKELRYRFPENKELYRHMTRAHAGACEYWGVIIPNSRACPYPGCGYTSPSAYNLSRHQSTCPNGPTDR